jgi:hypothetical protein
VPKWIVKLLAKVEHLVDDAADKVVDVGDTAANKTLPDTE